ncbi:MULTISPECIES: TnpV protein [Hungatella]|uniref:TnpV protein n=1 Tax=Hungatella hathewayi TaxID=154046 RepID=A0A3E3DGB2_9FIRM|nr:MULTISPECIES: TnpV protein [Hungatella]MDU0930981.1 TnpV protein [Hungatella hathewayi]RGD68320.1 TnpV protein [Hungatella hathewayi]
MSKEALMPLEYTQGEDGMLYPNLSISREKQYDQIPAGKYGKIWKEFMMDHHPERVTDLIMRGEINRMITKVDEEAEERKEQLIQKLLENQPMPVKGDMMNRAAHMNLLMMTAEEVIIREVVCQMR